MGNCGVRWQVRCIRCARPSNRTAWPGSTGTRCCPRTGGPSSVRAHRPRWGPIPIPEAPARARSWRRTSSPGCSPSTICTATRIESAATRVEFSAVIGELIEVLEDPGRANSPELPVARALRDLDGRVAAMGSPVQRRRWADDTEKYLLAKLWEAGRRRAGPLPPLASYVHLRRLGGANVACLMLTDISLGREVSAEVMCSPPMTELVKAAADLADLDNDLLSFARESGPGEEFPINGVTAAALHGARDTAAAVDCALRFRDSRMRALLELSVHFARSPDSPAADFSRGVCDWVSGHIDWIMKSGRYSQLPLGSVDWSPPR
ncbi:terpene synthase family protein [Nocardia tengchongensis]|uniref:terpene synthase family protein n=1 Tax=Nocardia tengchongensis TaxID=2055889 RepID=UPI0036B0EF5F